MPLREEIEGFRDRALSDLNSAHDYYTYTKRAWGALRLAISRDALALSWHNPSTNSSVDEQQVLLRAQRYIAVELASASLQQFVSIFESFLAHVVRAWLLAYPERLSKRQLSGKEILSLPDKVAIVDALVEREVRDVFYDRPANWFDYVKGLVNIGSPSSAETEHFAEIKATRDVLIHGQGIANAYYADKAGNAARTQSGQPLDIPEPYHQESWNLIYKLVRDIGTDMAAKA